MSSNYCSSSGIYPCSAAAWIQVVYPSGRGASGSGAVVGKNDVLTASHLVYKSSEGGLATEIMVYPGIDGSSLPYGPYEADRAVYLEVDQDGDNKLTMDDVEADFAVLGFEEDLGRDTGWFFLSPESSSGYYRLTGYPAPNSGETEPEMITDTGYVSGVAGRDLWDYSKIGAESGQSGGPLWQERDSGAFVAGIVSTESAGPDISSRHQALEEWIAENDDLVGNIAPESREVRGTAAAGQTIEIDVLANDSDPDGDGLTVSRLEDPEHGSAKITENGLIEYTPDDNFRGTETFSYIAGDGKGGEDEAGIVVEVAEDGSAGFPVNQYGLIQEFYIGFYGRPADPEGLDFWACRVSDRGGDFSGVLEEFAVSEEAENYVYRDPDSGHRYGNEDLVENLYGNLFDRQADPEGLEFYSEGLESGEFALREIVKAAIDGARGTDEEIMENRISVAMHFTNRLAGGDNYRNHHIPYAKGALEAADETPESVDEGMERAEMAAAVIGQEEELELTGIRNEVVDQDFC